MTDQQQNATAREILTDIYLDFYNNYLTSDCYAEANGLTNTQGETLINLAREVARTSHPDS